MIALALAASLLTAQPQPPVVYGEAAGWLIQRDGAECSASIRRGSGDDEIEFMYGSRDGGMQVGGWMRRWDYPDGAQPDFLLYFIGPGQMWPNLTAVTLPNASGGAFMFISFTPEVSGQVDTLMRTSQRLQIAKDAKTQAVVDLTGIDQALVVLDRCLAER